MIKQTDEYLCFWFWTGWRRVLRDHYSTALGSLALAVFFAVLMKFGGGNDKLPAMMIAISMGLFALLMLWPFWRDFLVSRREVWVNTSSKKIVIFDRTSSREFDARNFELIYCEVFVDGDDKKKKRTSVFLYGSKLRLEIARFSNDNYDESGEHLGARKLRQLLASRLGLRDHGWTGT